MDTIVAGNLSDPADMARRGGRATVLESSGCGHAPALLDREQIGVAVDCLDLNGGSYGQKDMPR